MRRFDACNGGFRRRFGGDGRAGAAGVDHLPDAELPRFVAELTAAQSGG